MNICARTFLDSCLAASVEQALFPKGVFAMQLAATLKLGLVLNEAKAEELLSGPAQLPSPL
jgi:hypothetical protein